MEKGQHCTVHCLQEKKTTRHQVEGRLKMNGKEETVDTWKAIPNNAAHMCLCQFKQAPGT